jgi:hypothetical protein
MREPQQQTGTQPELKWLVNNPIVKMQCGTNWDITPYSPMIINRRFEETCCLHLYGLRIGVKADDEQSFEPEDAGCFFETSTDC